MQVPQSHMTANIIQWPGLQTLLQLNYQLFRDNNTAINMFKQKHFLIPAGGFMTNIDVDSESGGYDVLPRPFSPWWRHQMEAFSALLAICAGNSPVPGEFPTQRPVTRSFDVYFDLRLNKRLCKQWWCWWFETLLCPLWRHSNDNGFWGKLW